MTHMNLSQNDWDTAAEQNADHVALPRLGWSHSDQPPGSDEELLLHRDRGRAINKSRSKCLRVRLNVIKTDITGRDATTTVLIEGAPSQ